MSRYVAAVAVVRGTVVAAVHPDLPGVRETGLLRSEMLLADAISGPGPEDEAGLEALRRAGREAWRTRQERGGAS